MKRLIFLLTGVLIFAVLVTSSWGKFRIGGGFVMGESFFTPIVTASPTSYWNTAMTDRWDTAMTGLWDTTMDTEVPE